jgi:hypothetical protein
MHPMNNDYKIDMLLGEIIVIDLSIKSGKRSIYVGIG